jgi:hypothetical protein
MLSNNFGILPNGKKWKRYSKMCRTISLEWKTFSNIIDHSTKLVFIGGAKNGELPWGSGGRSGDGGLIGKID